jgi:hypothetical protein
MRSPDLSRGKIDPGPHASGVMFALFLAGAKASRLPRAGADRSGRADRAHHADRHRCARGCRSYPSGCRDRADARRCRMRLDSEERRQRTDRQAPSAVIRSQYSVVHPLSAPGIDAMTDWPIHATIDGPIA